MLERQPGQKEARFAHLLSGEPVASASPTPRSAPAADAVTALAQQVAELQGEVAQLRADMDRLRTLLD
jgi:hypothetical protein